MRETANNKNDLATTFSIGSDCMTVHFFSEISYFQSL